jgi:hypothetical protein
MENLVSLVNGTPESMAELTMMMGVDGVIERK